MKVTQLCRTLCNAVGLYSLWNSPGHSSGVGSCSLLWEIFPTQGLNSSLPHHRWILYQLNHQGSPRILEWVAYPFSRGPSRLRNWTGVSCIAEILYQLSYQHFIDQNVVLVAKSYQALSDPMGFSPPGSSVQGIFRKEYWSGLQFPSPGNLPHPGIEPMFPAW